MTGTDFPDGTRHRLGGVVRAARAAAACRDLATAEWLAVDRALDPGDPAGPDLDGTPLPDPLGRVATVFGLGETEARLLLVAAAADLDPNLALAFGLLTGDGRAGPVTAGLALELAGVGPMTLTGRHALHDRAPLIRWQLLRGGSPTLPLLQPLVAHPDVVLALAGSLAFGGELGVMWCGRRRPTDDGGGAPAGTAARAIAAGLTAGEPLIWVETAPSADPEQVMAGFAAAGISCTVVDLAARPAGRPISETMIAAIRSAALAADGLAVRGADALGEDSAARAVMHELGAAPVPVVLIGSHPWNPAWHPELPLVVDLSPMTARERVQAWRRHLPDEAPSGQVLTGLRVSDQSIGPVARHALRSAAAGHGDEPLSSRLATGVVLSRGQSVRESGHVHGDPLDELCLPEPAGSEIRRIRDWVRLRDTLTERTDILTRGGRNVGLTALFSGSPGTGKTLAARVIAQAAGLELLSVDLSTVVDKYIGETEKKLEALFTDAERSNAVLFFDEADSLFGSRSEVKDARDRYANQEIAYLLQRMEHFDGITVLATNLRGNLDPAFARRLQFIITFPDPDEPTRRRLWEHHLACLPRIDAVDPVDSAGLAKALDLAGGDIRNIVLSAAYAGIAAGEPVGMSHLVDAAIREYAKLGRRIPEMLARRAPAP